MTVTLRPRCQGLRNLRPEQRGGNDGDAVAAAVGVIPSGEPAPDRPDGPLGVLPPPRPTGRAAIHPAGGASSRVTRVIWPGLLPLHGRFPPSRLQFRHLLRYCFARSGDGATARHLFRPGWMRTRLAVIEQPIPSARLAHARRLGAPLRPARLFSVEVPRPQMMLYSPADGDHSRVSAALRRHTCARHSSRPGAVQPCSSFRRQMCDSNGHRSLEHFTTGRAEDVLPEPGPKAPTRKRLRYNKLKHPPRGSGVDRCGRNGAGGRLHS